LEKFWTIYISLYSDVIVMSQLWVLIQGLHWIGS